MSYSFETIFTLNARGHVFLEVATQHFNLSDPNVFQLIQQLFRETKDLLRRALARDSMCSVLLGSVSTLACQHEVCPPLPHAEFCTCV